MECVSNIERNDLLFRAFHFIPGRHYQFKVNKNGETAESYWEVNTDPYNNSFIRCRQTGAMAYFMNDGNLFYFTHYEGDQQCLLYYFFLASFQVQQGYYQDLTIRDNYPLNLIYKQPLLGIQDMVAPGWKFLRSEYHCQYEWIDNEISPTEIRLVSSASNRIENRLLKRINFTILVDQNGIRKITAVSKNLQLEAICEV
jgi:hypothetical protein